MRPLLPLLGLMAACPRAPQEPSSEVGADAAPAFALVDVNPTSASHGDPVSPRDHLGAVSGWYFLHAT